MLKRIKKALRGTALEKPLRWLKGIFVPGEKNIDAEWGIRVQRDERNMQRLLKSTLQKNFNCIDIGAHKGDFLQRYLELAPDGKHFAFEPIPQLAGQLRLEFPLVQINECALSDTNGSTTFLYVPEMAAWSGMKTQAYPVDTHPVQLEVALKRLDDVIPNDVKIDFIKIDVEGAEFGVLRGAKATIQRSQPVILYEHAHIHSAEYGIAPEQVFDLLTENYGMNIYGLDGQGPYKREQYVDIYHQSFRSNYDRNAQTNFIARPVSSK